MSCEEDYSWADSQAERDCEACAVDTKSMCGWREGLSVSCLSWASYAFFMLSIVVLGEDYYIRWGTRCLCSGDQGRTNFPRTGQVNLPFDIGETAGWWESTVWCLVAHVINLTRLPSSPSIASLKVNSQLIHCSKPFSEERQNNIHSSHRNLTQRCRIFLLHGKRHGYRAILLSDYVLITYRSHWLREVAEQ